MPDIDKENQDSLFIRIQDVNNSVWVINKKHIISAASADAKLTRIVLTTDAIIDTYYPFGQLQRYLHSVEHKTDPPTDSPDTLK
jgi:1,2-phenylacetyl-CoA epoxidase PaaB subunit